MSFLSRRSSRADQRGGSGGAGRQASPDYDDEYDHAPGDYQQDDDNWSPDEYFSPEGIKGRWAAGARPGERSGGRGSRDDGRGYDDHGRGPQRARGPAGGYGRDAYQQDAYQQDEAYGGDYGTGEYGTGAYEIQDGDGDGDERGGGRKRRDRGGRRRLGRRDKGDDIWPDDGVSDEDYWASVAADRPFSSAGSPADGGPLNAADSRPLARPAAAFRPPAGDMRTGSGRLGPAPGQAGYLSANGTQGTHGTGSRPLPVGAAGPNSGPMARPGAGPNSGPMARPGSGPNSGPMARVNSGPMPMTRPGSGPNSGPMARPGTGPNSGPMTRPGTGPNSGPMARPGTGPSPAWQATGPIGGHGAPGYGASGPSATRPGTGPNAVRPAAGLAQPGFGHSSRTQPTVAQPSLSQAGRSPQRPALPSFQPNTSRGGGARGARQPERRERIERSDWGERTERIDRISASYPDPRVNGRGHASAAPQAPSAPQAPQAPQAPPAPPAPPAPQPSGPLPAPVSVWGRDGDAADRRLPDSRESRRRNGGEDDPLTSKRFSRDELSRTDGRSYRVASQRAQISAEQYAAALTEQTQTFSLNGGQYPADSQAATGGYPVRGGQQPAGAHGQQPRQSSNPYDQGTASYPYPAQPYSSRPAAADHGQDRNGRPAARPGGYDPGYGDRYNGGYGAYSNGRH